MAASNLSVPNLNLWELLNFWEKLVDTTAKWLLGAVIIGHWRIASPASSLPWKKMLLNGCILKTQKCFFLGSSGAVPAPVRQRKDRTDLGIKHIVRHYSAHELNFENCCSRQWWFSVSERWLRLEPGLKHSPFHCFSIATSQIPPILKLFQWVSRTSMSPNIPMVNGHLIY